MNCDDGEVKGTARATRRDLLRGGASVAIVAAAALAAPPVLGQTAARPREVLVLGAGMSGLTAALALHRRGHRVTVIERQNRIGGRLLSLPLGDGMFTEAGGGHFRSSMPHVLSYIRSFRLPLLALNDGLPRYLIDGKTAQSSNLAAWPWALLPEERDVTISASLNRYLYRVGLDTDSVLDTGWPGEELLEQFAHVTLGDLIRGVGASDAFCKLLDAHGGTFTSEGQALGGIPAHAYHFGDQNLFRIQGGNNRLPMAITNAIGPSRFVLGSPVKLIDQTGERVRVATADGREFSGDAVICTIPFTVIGEVDVKPGWSPAKLRMFAEMEWGNTVKVVAKTRTPAWLKKGVHGWPMAGGDRMWERVIDITGNEPGGHGNTFIYMNGANADVVLAKRPEDRAAFAIDQFRSDMPDLFDEVLATETFAWSEQPWIKGSFGFPPIGASWFLREFPVPEGKIHLAGDFTTMKSGWVEGAIESGLRAARQIDPDARPEGNPTIRRAQ
jgi:monoamine oxidase